MNDAGNLAVAYLIASSNYPFTTSGTYDLLSKYSDLVILILVSATKYTLPLFIPSVSYFTLKLDIGSASGIAYNNPSNVLQDND